MKFAQLWWLFGTGLALVVAVLLVLGGLLLIKSVRRFGDEAQVARLTTSQAGGPRALKGALLVLAVALGFVALAQPQYGRGTRLIPATNLDVVIVLDYSKSMYARDVKPSRTARAKTEVGRLISDLPGARFGAVAFAGQPMSFPLTSDGGAIAQFFRQLSPNDMPVGGTAIARALEAGRELLERDPLSDKHEKVMILVTDGEDLEGNPESVARAAAGQDITIHVVQIGGRTPEAIPEVNQAGEVVGWRKLDSGEPLTTSLSVDGEKQLTRIAESTGGRVVRSTRGTTGIQEIASKLRVMMTEELAEKVETVYADVFVYPLALAILLLLVETFIPEAPRRRKKPPSPPPPQRRQRQRALQRGATALIASMLCAVLGVGGCEGGLDPVFEREAPEVNEAIAAYDAGDAAAAVDLLESYLSTGSCEGGQIGTPPRVRERPSAGFDLGLGLFAIAERFGQRFGEEESDAGLGPEAQAQLAKRGTEIECALRIVRLIGGDSSVPIDLRARAHYLAGNLEFLRGDYDAAVKAYDLSLKLIPGLPEDAGDLIGRDAAWNRAIALQRKQDEEQDASPDAQPDAPPDSPPDAPEDAPDDGGQDAGAPDGGDGGEDGGSRDAGNDGSKQDEQGDNADSGPPDAGNTQPPPEAPKESPNVDQDERMLDMLERAPTLQEQTARDRALQREVRGMEDK